MESRLMPSWIVLSRFSIRKYSLSFISTFTNWFSLRDGKLTSEPNPAFVGISHPANIRVQGVGGDGTIPRPLFEPWSMSPNTPTPLSPVSIFHKGGNPTAKPIMSANVPVSPYWYSQGSEASENMVLAMSNKR